MKGNIYFICDDFALNNCFFFSKSSFVTESFDSCIACRRGGNSRFLSPFLPLLYAVPPTPPPLPSHTWQLSNDVPLCKAKPLVPETSIESALTSRPVLLFEKWHHFTFYCSHLKFFREKFNLDVCTITNSAMKTLLLA